MAGITKENTINLTNDYSILASDYKAGSILATLADLAIYNTLSDVSSVFLETLNASGKSYFNYYKKGNHNTTEFFCKESSLIQFINDSKETIVLLKRKKSPFIDILLSSDMHSGIAIPLVINSKVPAILIVNSLKINFYNNERFNYLTSLSDIASLMFKDIKLYKELVQTIKINSTQII